ncbi:MAG: hypothetical protein QM831_23065 [Kofleriaceae bacterium]
MNMVMDEDKDVDAAVAAMNAQALHDAARTVRPVRADGTHDDVVNPVDADGHPVSEEAMAAVDDMMRVIDELHDDLELELGGERPQRFLNVNDVLDQLMRNDSPRRVTDPGIDVEEALNGFHDEPATDIYPALPDTTNEVPRDAVLDSWELPRLERWFVHLRAPLDIPRGPNANPFEDAVNARLMKLLTERLRIVPE